jgi:hypothetical protein
LYYYFLIPQKFNYLIYDNKYLNNIIDTFILNFIGELYKIREYSVLKQKNPKMYHKHLGKAERNQKKTERQ